MGPPVPVAISTRSLRRPRVRVTQSRDCHREYFGGEEYEAVAFNKDQHIVVVGQRVTPEIRQTASFLGSKGIHVTCVEFTFFQAEGGGGRLLSHEIVVGRERAKPRRSTLAAFAALRFSLGWIPLTSSLRASSRRSRASLSDTSG